MTFNGLHKGCISPDLPLLNGFASLRLQPARYGFAT
jgi:hypothetical protein